jgi:hypothetical protein
LLIICLGTTMISCHLQDHRTTAWILQVLYSFFIQLCYTIQILLLHAYVWHLLLLNTELFQLQLQNCWMIFERSRVIKLDEVSHHPVCNEAKKT